MREDEIKKVKYQVIKKYTGTPYDATKVEVTFNDVIDQTMQRVTGFFVYAKGFNLTTNVNMKVDKPLKIDSSEIFPVDFDTFLLFPRLENDAFTTIDAKAAGSRLEGKLTLNDTAPGAAMYVTVVLKLEN